MIAPRPSRQAISRCGRRAIQAPGRSEHTAQARRAERLRWRCPHEVAHALLGHLADEAVRCGDLGRAVGAMELRAEMVVSGTARCFTPAVQAVIDGRMAELAHGLAALHGAAMRIVRLDAQRKQGAT